MKNFKNHLLGTGIILGLFLAFGLMGINEAHAQSSADISVDRELNVTITAPESQMNDYKFGVDFFKFDSEDGAKEFCREYSDAMVDFRLDWANRIVIIHFSNPQELAGMATDGSRSDHIRQLDMKFKYYQSTIVNREHQPAAK